MADQNQVSIIRRGTYDWNTWRRQNSLVRVDLSTAYLNLANLREAHLDGANLADADLCDALLRYAQLNAADLRGARLDGANLDDAQLRGALLSNAHLSRTRLSWTNLQGARLTNAVLYQADICRANLEHADLAGAHLQSVSLVGANLNGANLSDAHLEGAILSGATVVGTNFRNTHVGGTVFGELDLSTAIGLDSCIHHGPSILDFRTIENSSSLPESFMHGCGLSERLIDYLSTFLSQPIEFYSCFISYSHVDEEFANHLHKRLQKRGINCWLDSHQMLPGDDVHERVDKGIRLWDKVLLCCSRASLERSWWVDSEINRALEKEVALMKERGEKVLALIPLDLDRYLFDGWQSGKATEVKSRHAADFTDWKNNNAQFEREFERVVKALRADGSGRDAPPISKL